MIDTNIVVCKVSVVSDIRFDLMEELYLASIVGRLYTFLFEEGLRDRELECEVLIDAASSRTDHGTLGRYRSIFTCY